MMHRLLIAAILGGISFGAAADDLSEALKAQGKIQQRQSQAADQRISSDRLREGGSALTVKIFREFYRQAKASGVRFESMANTPEMTHDSTGAVTTEIVGSEDVAHFLIGKNCVWGTQCTLIPTVKVTGIGEQGMGLYYDGADGYPDSEPTLKSSCRFAAFGDFYSLPCAKLFDKQQLPGVQASVIAWLKKGLTKALQAETPG